MTMTEILEQYELPVTIMTENSSWSVPHTVEKQQGDQLTISFCENYGINKGKIERSNTWRVSEFKGRSLKVIKGKRIVVDLKQTQQLINELKQLLKE